MLKKITAVLLALLIAILLCGCGYKGMATLGDQTKEPTTFRLAERYNDFDVVVDTDTGVMYAVSSGGYNRGTLTLLVNADGSPKQFPGFDAKEDRYG